MQEERDRYGVEEKCRAVLSVWTGRQTAAELCRELKLSSALFWQWQDRALSGMLEALEPRGAREISEGPALPEPIRRLLDRKVRTRELCRVGRRPLSRGRPSATPALAPLAASN